jgi:hypothetical protein
MLEIPQFDDAAVERAAVFRHSFPVIDPGVLNEVDESRT